jgi:hypothetical protein
MYEFATPRFVGKNGLIHRVLTFVKDEGGNLGSMATTLQSIINCKLINILQMYEGICFGHVTSKACKYTTNHDKVSIGLFLVNVKGPLIGL